jgi:hypothetical protein
VVLRRGNERCFRGHTVLKEVLFFSFNHLIGISLLKNLMVIMLLGKIIRTSFPNQVTLNSFQQTFPTEVIEKKKPFIASSQYHVTPKASCTALSRYQVVAKTSFNISSQYRVVTTVSSPVS